jgi:hypothetical protein
MDEAARADLQRRTERWFIRRGLPHFISRYSARSDVLTRAALFLAVVFVVEMLSTFSPDRGGWSEVLPFLGGLALLLGSWALVNRLRGGSRRPFQRPDTIGPIELAVFVLLPAVPSMLFHDDPVADALAIVVFNLVLLGVAYLVTSYGLIPMSRWAVGHLMRQFGDLANLTARALPLMLLFATVLFLNAEIWQVASDFVAPFFVISIGMIFSVGLFFVVLRLPRELDAVSQFDSWAQVERLAEGTPLEGVHPTDEGDGPDLPRPSGRAWLNVGLVMVFSQGVQILLVSTLLGLFYLVFGLFSVREATMLQWVSDQDLSVIAEGELFGSQIVFTWELVRVSVFVAAFSGLQFTVSVLTDSTYREEFFEGAVDQVRESLAVRALYLEEVVPPGAEGSLPPPAGVP